MEKTALKKLREQSGETQLELANLLGLKTASAYNKKENGKVTISIDEAKILAEHYQKPLDVIWS